MADDMNSPRSIRTRTYDARNPQATAIAHSRSDVSLSRQASQGNAMKQTCRKEYVMKGYFRDIGFCAFAVGVGLGGCIAAPDEAATTPRHDLASPEDVMRLPARPATALSPSPQLGINAGVRKFTTLHDFEDLDGDGTDDLTVVNGDWRDPAFPFGTSWLMSQGDGTYADAYAPRPDEPFGSVWYTRADFDGNGRTDFIITDYSGSWWYFDGVPGPWRQNVYYRPDLTYGNVEFTIGDFNGDGRSDYIVTTSQGSSWYFSDGFGGFYWVFGRPDLTLNNVHYTPGDFNGDGKTDLIVTTPSGSSWWASIGDGSWDEQYTRSDLVLNGVSYTPGDFNGDGKTDLVITTAAGSWWYLAVTPLPWYQFLFVFEADVFPVRPDLPLGTVDYTAADLNGDGMTDLVITNLSGSYWYILNGVTGTIYQPYTRLDLKRGSVRFKASDFNGDGRSDLLVTTYAGTDWLRSTTIGSGQLIASRPSLSLFAMQLF